MNDRPFLNEISFTGIQINYYFICVRKLWFFSKNISMETDSDLVLLGKILHHDSYSRKSKEFLIDNKIVIDFVEGKNILHEIKKSNKMEQAHIYQMLYYLYYLKNKGLNNLKGVINYPLLRQKVEVVLTDEKQKEVEKILVDIKNIIEKNSPPELEKQKHCRACSYYELCFV